MPRLLYWTAVAILSPVSAAAGVGLAVAASSASWGPAALYAAGLPALAYLLRWQAQRRRLRSGHAGRVEEAQTLISATD